jgi:hypothetical protein
MYRLEGFTSYNTTNGCDAERFADTMLSAKREARYMLTDCYMRACESTAPVVVVHILRDGELIHELS